MSQNDWKDWLSEEKSEYLVKIRNAVKTIHDQNQNKRPLAFYTPHGPKHFQMVEDNIHKLIEDDKAKKHLEEEERFYLLASAWLHDLGMYRSVVIDVYGGDLEDNEIREKHHITSAKFILNHFDKCGVKEIDKDFFATLCEYHRRRENIEKCPTVKSVGVDNKSLKLKLLAAYLRLADSLDIGTYRTPTPAYAICLAYNIPQESKMHWIKNRIISGIFIDPESHKISVEFIEPKIEDNLGYTSKKIMNEKLDYVIELVVQDLYEELNSVKQILISNGVSYFLEIVQKKNLEYISEQTANDLIEMVANYDILVHPSASKLLEMVLLTISNICGYHMVKYEKPQKFSLNRNGSKSRIFKELNDFLSKIESELVSSRPCHYGLSNLITLCNEYVKVLEKDKDIDKFLNSIAQVYSSHHEFRHNIRVNASSLFEKKLLQMDDEKEKFIIVLYGYSELSIKAICGFRDSILLQKYPSSEPKEFYNHNYEFKISNKFMIFVCEGQPKTVTATQDKMIYHDGVRYAEALKNRNFDNVIMIPDAVIGNIFKNFEVDLVLVGANGFDSEYFVHSSGHASVINLGLYHKFANKCINPLIVLTTTKEKFLAKTSKKQKNKAAKKTVDDSSDNKIIFYEDSKVDGREKLWFLRDAQVIKQLSENNIYLFNPREDRIPIKDLDYIITDNGCYTIKGGLKNPKNVQQKIETFINAQQVH